MKKHDSTIELLNEYFRDAEVEFVNDNIAERVHKVRQIEDLVTIDRNIADPLWMVVPQLALNLFGLEGFKEFKYHHSSDVSFVFVHPSHGPVMELLLSYLERESVNVLSSKSILLSPKVISSLYGGYPWYSAYKKACQHVDSMGSVCEIAIIDNKGDRYIDRIIDYKNENRGRLSKRILLKKEVLGTNMDGIINSFHSPDRIENARQLLALGLIKKSMLKFR